MSEEGICVAIRARPLNGREKIQGQRAIWRCLPNHNSITQTTPDGTPLPERNTGFTFFTYDKVFGEESSTQQVYEAIGKPIVSSVVQGFNGTIFAYGQTSSGKTFTMQGDDTSEGILHMAANDIFQLISQTSDRDFLLRVSFVEIYNEIIRDLLDPETPTLQIREDPRKGVYIEAHESIITDFDSILTALKTGAKNRRVEATSMNERSSRSHTIFRMVLESKERGKDAVSGEEGDVDGAVLVATLNLVDLAGSESVRHTGATGQRAKEGGKINQSLLTLSRVIHALGQEGSVHVNFRDSKLTRILQPSLSGNAKMAVVCCVTPADRYLEETRSTLQFASRAKMVRTCAVVNEVLDDQAQLKRLKKELQELKDKQKVFESGGPMVPLEDVSRLEAQKEEMTGKVVELEAELEAVREDHANKITRLANLIMQGGAVGQATQPQGPARRRHKRLRETWCPGESGVPLPPGAALRSVRELAEDDEADDRLVSSLSFGKAINVAGSSRSGKSRRAGSLCGPMMPRLSEISNDEMGGRDDLMSASSGSNNDIMRLEELLAARDSTLSTLKGILLQATRGADFMETEDDNDVDVISLAQGLAQAHQAGDASGGAVTQEDEEGARAHPEVERLKEALSAAQAETDSLRNQLQEQQMGMQAEIDRLQQDAEALREEQQSLRDQHQSAMAAAEEGQTLQASLDDARARLEAALQEVEGLKEAIQAAQLSEASKDEEVENLKVALEEARSSLTTNPTEEVEAKLSGMQAEMESMRQALEVAGEAAYTSSQRIEELEQEAEMLRQALSAEAVSMSQPEANHESVETPEEMAQEAPCDSADYMMMVEGHELEGATRADEPESSNDQEEVAALRQALAEAQESARLEAEKLEGMTQALAEAESQLKDMATTASSQVELQAEIDTLKQAFSDAEELARLKSEEVTSLSQALEEAHRSVKESQEELIKAREKLHQAEEMDTSTMGISEMEDQVERGALVDKKDSLQREVESLSEALRIAEEGALLAAEEIEALRNDVTSAHASGEAVKQEAASMKESIQALEEKCQALAMGCERAAEEAAAYQQELTTLRSVCEKEKSMVREWLELTGAEPMETEEADGVDLLAQLRSSLSMQLAVLKTQLASKCQENEELQSKLDQTNKWLQTLQAEKTQLEGQSSAEGQPMGMTDVDPSTSEPTAMESESMVDVDIVSPQPSMAKRRSCSGASDTGSSAKKPRTSTGGPSEDALGVNHTLLDMFKEVNEEHGDAEQEPVPQVAELQERIRTEEEKCRALSEQISAIRQEMEESQASLRVSMERAMMDAEARLAEAVALQDRYARDTASMQSTINSLEARVMAMGGEDGDAGTREAEIEASTSLVAELQNQVEALSTELSQMRDDLVSKGSEVAQERKEKEEALAEVSRLMEAMQPQEQEGETMPTARSQGLFVNEQNARLEAERALKEAQDSTVELTSQLKRSEEKIVELLQAEEEKGEAFKREHERHQSDLALKEAEIKHLQEQLGNLGAQLHEAQSAPDGAWFSQGDAASNDEGLRKRVSQLQTQLDLAQSMVDKHAARIKELEGENRKLIREAEDEARQLTQQLEQARGSAGDVVGMKREVERLGEACRAMEGKISNLKTERDEAEERATGASHALQEAQAELETLRETCATYEADGSQAIMTSLKEQLEASQERCEVLEAAKGQAEGELHQTQNRLRRVQQEMARLEQEAAASPVEAMKEQMAVMEDDLRTKEAAIQDLEERLQQAVAESDARLRGMMEEGEALRTQLQAAYKDMDSVKELQEELAAAKAEAVMERERADNSEESRENLLREMNGLAEAKIEAEYLVGQRDKECKELQKKLQAVEQEVGARLQAEMTRLSEEMARKEKEYNVTHSDNYRLKRQLTELQEAADAAEEMLAANAEEVQQSQAETKAKAARIADLERSVAEMRSSIEAKDKRIQKLENVRVTQDFLERVQKIKNERSQFAAENAQMKQELHTLREALLERSSIEEPCSESGKGKAGSSSGALLAELKAAKESLSSRLQEATEKRHTLEMERTSIIEALEDIAVTELRFDQVPNDLGTAVGLLLERVTSHWGDQREAMGRVQNSQDLLLDELRAARQDKDSLEQTLAGVRASLESSKKKEKDVMQRLRDAEDQCHSLRSDVSRLEGQMKEMQNTHALSGEEKTRSIRFLEKENLQLMMEAKELRGKLTKLQAEVEVFRAASQAVAVGATSRPSLATATAAAPCHPTHALRDSTNLDGSFGGNASSHFGDGPSKEMMGSATKGPRASAGGFHGPGGLLPQDKENLDEVPPGPFRSLNEDDTMNANSQCRQS